MDTKLKQFLDEAKELRRDIKAEQAGHIAKKHLRERAERLGKLWFETLAKELESYAFSEEVLQRYSAGCGRLIKLSQPNNRRTSYLKTLDAIVHRFRDDLILPIQRKEVQANPASVFTEFVAKLPDADENVYFQEAIDCAKSGFLRAATVMGWCAAIDRIHRKIDRIGFARFNVVSAQMASQTKGRYKRFNQAQNVTSLSDLREVFDTTILWIIEGMNLIDANQHTRLRSCFEMRCQCAHPGDAPLTEYNLMSFFSDIRLIILENAQFAA